MDLRLKRVTRVGVALATGCAVLAGGMAQAQSYPYAYPDPGQAARLNVGPADPCARQAAQRRLGWGIVGLLAGGLAGGAAAGAGVVAEGAGLGGFVGSIVGGVAGSRSAACGTAALAAASGAYGPYQGYETYPSQAGGYYPQQGGGDYGYQAGYYHPTYSNPGPQPVSYYEYRRTTRTYTTDGGYAQAQAYDQAPPQVEYYQGPPQGYAPPQQDYAPQYAPQYPPEYVPQYAPQGRY